MKNKIFQLFKWVSLLLYFIMILGFTAEKKNKLICKKINIMIEGEHRFINEKIVKQILSENKIVLDSCKLDTLNYNNIEKFLNSHPAISSSQAFYDISGTIHINVKQREPILRVISNDNNSFYIDREGLKMPLFSNYTAHVPVLSGSVKKFFSKNYKQKTKINNDNYSDELFNFINFTQSHNLWKYQISQIYIADNYEVELVPKLGDYIIYLGNLDNYEYKLNKLETLYKTAHNKINWEAYSVIDIRYSDQVILKKK